MKTAYIVKAYRTAVGKAPKGVFRFKRPDELAAETIEYMMNELPNFDKTRIDDVMVGNAMPEAEQGLNVARLISLMGLKVEDVPGVTVNRYCASGIETIGMATAKIQSGMADCIIAGGAESMSYIPMGGYKPTPDYKVAKGASIDLGLRLVDGLYADFSIVDEEFYAPDNRGAVKLPSYGLVDLGATYRMNNWTLRLNVNNLLDATYIAESNTSIHADETTDNWNGINTANSVWFGFGRTWNASLRYNF